MSHNNKTRMNSGDDATKNLEVINPDESEDEELVREELRKWAIQYSKGENSQSFMSPNYGHGFEESESQASTPQNYELERYQFPFPDWSQYMKGDPQKKPSPVSGIERREPEHDIEFEGLQKERPVASDNGLPPVPPMPFIPPIPPIPERWRAEWEWQEMKRRAEFIKRPDPESIRRKARATMKYLRTPQLAYPPEEDTGEREAAPKRANLRRRKAFDAVVLEDQQDSSGNKLFVRPDARLPRSPGMLDLSQEKEKEEHESQGSIWSSNSSQESFDLDLYDEEDLFSEEEYEEEGYTIADRAFKDMADSYARSMAIVSEAVDAGVQDEKRDKNE